MSYCPKCGNKIDEEMSFCPKCGAPLKTPTATAATPSTPVPSYRREEKTEEKSEKHEKREKHEKNEKREYGFMGPLIGGLILLFIGSALYLRATTSYPVEILWALFFVLVGVVIIIGGVYGVIVAGRRHPKT
jgi:uncharacterized membrane protein YvbJ